MASKSLPTAGSTHSLWISTSHVLDVSINKASKGFPPDPDHNIALSQMIQGLARAANSVLHHAENESSSTDFLVQPIGDIANAIILLSQLSEAVSHELNEEARA